MADDFHITRAFNLLQEATALLSGGVESSSRDSININESANESIVSSTLSSNVAFGRNSLDTPPSNVSATLSTSGPTPSSSNEFALQSTATRTRTTDQQNVLRNFQSLFSPYSRSSQRLGRSPGSMPIRNNRRSRQQPATASRALKEETWTHDVFCLASTSQLVAPNREKKAVLQNAGLGRKKIRFNAKGTPQTFKETLEQSFPKLICGGGFELLRRGVSGNQLALIQPPASGYSVPFLKSCEIGQAILYVRPIQCDLDTNPEVEEPECEISPEDAENAPKVSCVRCGASVPVTIIRDHQEDCIGNEDLAVDEQETGPSSVSLPSCSYTNDADDIRISLLLPSLRDIFPSETEDILRQALRRSNFDLAGATEIVLNPEPGTTGSNDGESDRDVDELLDRPLNQIPTARKKLESNDEQSEHYDICNEIESFREAKIDSEAVRQLFTVCRDDGEAVMKADILAMYKNPRTNLLARPRVRFEGEEGVGAGPLREFLQVAVKIVEEGIDFSTKPVIYFEGEPDYKLPVHNPSLRNTGSFRAVGRILAHSFLHGGPCIHGLSKAVKHYFASQVKQDLSSDPPPLELQDVPDFDLRMLLKEILDLPPEEKLSDETVSNIMPFVLEAGVDIELLYSNREMVCQCLLMHFVIEKRKIELDDILIGMEVVGLKTFIEKHPQSVELIFPSQKDALIDVNEMKSKILFQEDGSDAHNAVKEMFLQYIDVIDSRMEVGAQIQDLCCFWTGWNVLPPRSEKLNVMFDKTSTIELPMAECCFNNLILPVLHTTLEDFKMRMDVAIKHGSKGFTFS